MWKTDLVPIAIVIYLTRAKVLKMGYLWKQVKKRTPTSCFLIKITFFNETIYWYTEIFNSALIEPGLTNFLTCQYAFICDCRVFIGARAWITVFLVVGHNCAWLSTFTVLFKKRKEFIQVSTLMSLMSSQLTISQQMVELIVVFQRC
jgi:hypothetical protein